MALIVNWRRSSDTRCQIASLETHFCAIVLNEKQKKKLKQVGVNKKESQCEIKESWFWCVYIGKMRFLFFCTQPLYMTMVVKQLKWIVIYEFPSLFLITTAFWCVFLQILEMDLGLVQDNVLSINTFDLLGHFLHRPIVFLQLTSNAVELTIKIQN